MFSKWTRRRWQSSSSLNHSLLNKQIVQCSTANDIETLILNNSSHFNAINCASAFRALSRTRSFNAHIKDKLIDASSSLQFPPRALSNCFHALATTTSFSRQIPPLFFSKLLLDSNLEGFNSQDIGNILWSVAKQEKNNTPSSLQVCHEFAKELVRRDSLADFTAQDLANTIWAFSTVQVCTKELLQRLSGEVHSRGFDTFSPQGIANILWGFSHLGFPCDTLSALASQHMGDTTKNLSAFTGQNLAHVLYAFSKSSPDVVPLTVLQRICTELVSRRPHEFTVLDYANILHSLAELQFYDQALLTAFDSAMLDLLPKFTSKSLVNVLWAWAMLHYKNDTLLHALAQEFHARRGYSRHCTLQESATLCWSFACLDFLDNALVRGLVENCVELACAQHDDDKVTLMDAQQLLQLKLVSPYPLQVPEWVHIKVLGQAKEVPSQSHMYVWKLLQDHFPDISVEKGLLGGGIVVDLYIEQYNAVVEVDGPFHYLRNHTKRQNGATLFKRRLLEQHGFRVFSIPSKEFKLRTKSEQGHILQSLARVIRENKKKH